MPNVNEYRSRIGIYKRVLVANGFGGFTQTWSEVDTVWCNITPLVGFERVRYQQVFPDARDRINIRYRPDVNTDFRLYYRKKFYNILSIVNVDNMDDELEILTEVTQGEQ